MLRKIGDKKGQGLPITTIILVLLGVAVLVFLIWGFSTGWGNLWGKITAYIGGGSNVDDTKSSCEYACSGLRESSYCSEVRTVKMGDGSQLKGSCKTLESSLVTSCSNIDCGTNVPKRCSDTSMGGTWKDKCESSEDDKTSSIGDSEGKDIKTNKCCVTKPA